MRYDSMEEAAGQYLAKMLKDSFVEMNETPSYGNYNYCDNAIVEFTVMTSVEKKDNHNAKIFTGSSVV